MLRSLTRKKVSQAETYNSSHNSNVCYSTNAEISLGELISTQRDDCKTNIQIVLTHQKKKRLSGEAYNRFLKVNRLPLL